MRDIIFRGLKTDGTWIYGSLVVTNGFLKCMPACHTKTWIVSSSFGNGGWFNIRRRAYVRPHTVGQFTGMQDINGIKIYEGDIVKSHFYGDEEFICIAEIKYDQSSAAYVYDNSEQDAFIYGAEQSVLEVIGNIHENKDLLK